MSERFNITTLKKDELILLEQATNNEEWQKVCSYFNKFYILFVKVASLVTNHNENDQDELKALKNNKHFETTIPETIIRELIKLQREGKIPDEQLLPIIQSLAE